MSIQDMTDMDTIKESIAIGEMTKLINRFNTYKIMTSEKPKTKIHYLVDQCIELQTLLNDFNYLSLVLVGENNRTFSIGVINELAVLGPYLRRELQERVEILKRQIHEELNNTCANL